MTERNEARVHRAAAVATLVLMTLAILGQNALAATIYVTTVASGVGTGACSLQEAIYSSVLHQSLDGGAHGIAIDATDSDHFITTGCVLGTGDDTIVLPTKGLLQMNEDLYWDAHNPFGPTATPLIFSKIRIEGNGATLQWTGSGYARLFAIGEASIKIKQDSLDTTASGTGSLTLHNVYVTGFRVKGGDGTHGGGGGLGAGGAIYLGKIGSGSPSLTIENSTFAGNGATGGNGGGGTGLPGGGGGLAGQGGHGACSPFTCKGGGGGGARGKGGDAVDGGGGGGGGTVFAGADASNGIGGPGGYRCGGKGGNQDDGNDGQDAQCPGGGGGGAGAPILPLNPYATFNGHTGAYGGGGGGGDNGAGHGGFGGGGGAAAGCTGQCAGNGGFGGGGGAPDGQAGPFGGHNYSGGGGGGALGGAIFNDGGTLVVQNSTFYNNAVLRGVGAFSQGNGGDAGGAIFSRNGSTTIKDSTIAGGLASGSGGGIVVYQDGGTTSFTLQDTIVAGNGDNECFFTGSVSHQGIGNLVMKNGPPASASDSGSCDGNISSVPDDPQLGTLQNNGGFTPTMAIPLHSSAMSHADSDTSVTTDQRGAVRPQAGGYDIGAYQICRRLFGDLLQSAPCGEFSDERPPNGATSVNLTVQVNPAGTGTTTPAAGSTYMEASGTVVPLTATPMTGYAFNGWTGPVAQPSLSSTTIVMDADHTVTANFRQHDFSLSPIAAMTIAIGGSASANVIVNSVGDFSDKVKLTVSGQPNGVKVTFGTSSLTPAAGGSIGTSMAISIGPSVTPQTFTLTITGTSGALTHSTQVVVTVQTTATALVSIINEDQEIGCLDNSGIGQSLITKVNVFQMLAGRGQTIAAANVLSAFQYEVQAQNGAHIAASCTDPVDGTQFAPAGVLRADAQSLLATIGATVKPTPIVGSVLVASGAGVSGTTVSLFSGKSLVATATTDAIGFYYFASTNGFAKGTTFTVQVTVPTPLKTATPTSQRVTWAASPVILTNFVLN